MRERVFGHELKSLIASALEHGAQGHDYLINKVIGAGTPNGDDGLIGNQGNVINSCWILQSRRDSFFFLSSE